MPIGTQARLLRVLESGEFIRVGSSKVQKTDVRVIAASNKDLLERSHQGKFREDLYYRLNTVPIAVPPLRERGNDIDLLFRKFTSDFAERYRITPVTLTPEARDTLISYNFPGNIRQLKNIAEQIQILEANNKVPITSQVMVKYLPNYASSTRSMTFLGTHNGPASEIFNERELLYKILFDMRRDVNDLKKLVLKVLNNEAHHSDIMREHGSLFSSIEAEHQMSTDHTKLLPSGSNSPSNAHSNANHGTSNANLLQIKPYDSRDNEIEDVVHEAAEDESLSLENKEKEMIAKALQRSNGKRKYAAQALGISERTLYRKIKQYDIEEK